MFSRHSELCVPSPHTLRPATLSLSEFSSFTWFFRVYPSNQTHSLFICLFSSDFIVVRSFIHFHFDFDHSPFSQYVVFPTVTGERGLKLFYLLFPWFHYWAEHSLIWLIMMRVDFIPGIEICWLISVSSPYFYFYSNLGKSAGNLFSIALIFVVYSGVWFSLTHFDDLFLFIYLWTPTVNDDSRFESWSVCSVEFLFYWPWVLRKQMVWSTVYLFLALWNEKSKSRDGENLIIQEKFSGNDDWWMNNESLREFYKWTNEHKFVRICGEMKVEIELSFHCYLFICLFTWNNLDSIY